MNGCQCWVYMPEFFGQKAALTTTVGHPWWAVPFDEASCPKCDTRWTACADIEAGFRLVA